MGLHEMSGEQLVDAYDESVIELRSLGDYLERHEVFSPSEQELAELAELGARVDSLRIEILRRIA